MIRKINISDPKQAKEVLDIQIPSYKVEAELIDFYEIPPLKDTVELLQTSGETFYGCYMEEELCGVISLKIDNEELDIHRLFVHPKHFKKGIAKRLLDYIETNERGFKSIIVSTGSKNIPAILFYQKNGFLITKELRVTDKLSLTFFKKTI